MSRFSTHFRFFIVGLSATYAGIALALDATVAPEEVGLSTERLDRYTSHITRMVEQGKLPGATIAVSRFGKLAYYKTIGWADVENRQPIKTDTIFRLHSMTKPLVAVAAMTLVEEGRLTLSDPIAQILPEFSDVQVFAGGSADAPELVAPESLPTVGQLLSQTAGLAAVGYSGNAVGKMYGAANIYDGNPTLSEYSERVARLPLAGHPGELFIYGMSYDILGRVIEVASDQTLDAFLTERLLKPLDMVDTAFVVSPEKASRFAQSYDIMDDGLKLVNRPRHVARWRPTNRFYSANGGMVSTVGDYLQFAHMLLHQGALDGTRILSRKTVDLIATTVVNNQASEFLSAATPGYGYGLGVGVLEDVAASQKPGTKGEFFWGGAADTYFFVDPEEKLVGLFFTQVYPAGSYRLREALQTFVYQALID